MNPLILLLGVFGAGTFVSSRTKFSENATSSSTDKNAYTPVHNDVFQDKGGIKTPGKTTDTSGGKDSGPVTSEPTDTGGISTPSKPAPEPTEPVSTGGTETPTEPAPEPAEPTDTNGTATPTEPAPEPTEPTDTNGTATPTEPEPEPEPTEPTNTGGGSSEPVDPGPLPPEQTGGSGESGGAGSPVMASSSVSVIGGRVTTLNPEGSDIQSVQILSGVEHGNVTVNPDNTLALVMTMSDFTGNQSFSYQTTDSSGATQVHTVNLAVEAGPQQGGWGTGQAHYMLETDENDRVITEIGENHTKVYISGSSNALSIADIAAIEGLSTSQITGQWLANHGGYGQSEDMALAEDAGLALWYNVTPANSQTSNWLLLERGYTYDDLPPQLFLNGAYGEDELHPVKLTSYGEGSAPVMSELTQWGGGEGGSSENIVIQDIFFTDGIYFIQGANVIFENVSATSESAIMGNDGATVRYSKFFDSITDDPAGSSWEPHLDREQGMYVSNGEGILFEHNFFDHNGWEDGWETDPSKMPPSMFSHNLYLQADLADVTLRDNITMRAGSFGAQVRSGGFIEDNVFIDNNAALNFVGGDYNGAGSVGQYTLSADNVVTSGANKVAEMIGALTQATYDNSWLASHVDNIVAHMMDPNGDEPWKTNTPAENVIIVRDEYYYDTIAYNWHGTQSESVDENVEGLDTAVLDQTTIQLFTAQLLGQQNATIADLADHLRTQSDGAFDQMTDADLIIRFFQEGFGIAPDIRAEAADINFVPSDLGEGVRWDNRLNWDTDDLPGLHAGDNVDLRGNHVVFGTNSEINTLDLGTGGWLNVYGGRLQVNGGLSGDGDLNVEGAGQIWTNGSDGSDIDITVSGGRFANTGNLSGADMTVTDGEAILATDGGRYEVGAGRALHVDGDARVGFDDDDGDIAILDLDEGALLGFSVGENGELGEISEFRSGAYGEYSTNVQSGIALDGTISINLAGLSAAQGNSLSLMSADELSGLFDEAIVDGLGARNANIVVDYVNDTVTLQLSSGNGAVSIETVGAENDVSSGTEALWQALTAEQGVAGETMAAEAAEPQDEEVLEFA